MNPRMPPLPNIPPGWDAIHAQMVAVQRAAWSAAIEAAAEAAEKMPHLLPISPKHVRGLRGSDVASAIRSLKEPE